MRRKLPVRLTALFSALIMLFMLPVGARVGIANAEEDEEMTYTISGYNKSRIIKDKDGNTISGYAYCLDSKEDTPSSSLTYKRYKLSEVDSYTKDHLSEGRVFTEAAKSRLVKLLHERTALRRIVRAIDPTEARAAIIAAGNNTITEEKMAKNWDDIVDNYMQKLVWTCVHDESYWPEFVLDDDKNGKRDNYRLSEDAGGYPYGYRSDDPMNDPYSLWTVFYQPIIDYLDNEVPDYYEQGYDAWVYLTEDTAHQNVLGAVFLDEDFETTVSISKTDIASGEEIEGAVLEIRETDGTVVNGADGAPLRWTSDGTAHVIKGLLTDHEYVLHEVTAPDGYTVTADTVFTANRNGAKSETGTIATDENGKSVLLIEDAMTSVKISKVDIADSEELSGAFIQILDAEGNVVLDRDGNKIEWTSDKEAHEIKGLNTNTVYTLHEETAPDGYTLTADTTFTIDENGNVTSEAAQSNEGVLLVEDAMTSVKISKVDIADSEELSGAFIQILDAEGNVVLDRDGNKIEWTSDKEEAHEIKGLNTNTVYTLHEETAPDGYTLTADTTFTIDENGNVTSEAAQSEDGVILVEDAALKITVNKTDLTGEKEVINAVMTITNTDLTAEQWQTIAETNKESVSLTESGDGITWISDGEAVELVGLYNGTYTLTETQGDEDITDADGTVYDVLESDVTFTIDNTNVNVITSDNAKDGFDADAEEGYYTLDENVLTICDAEKAEENGDDTGDNEGGNETGDNEGGNETGDNESGSGDGDTDSEQGGDTSDGSDSEQGGDGSDSESVQLTETEQPGDADLSQSTTTDNVKTGSSAAAGTAAFAAAMCLGFIAVKRRKK